MTGIDLTAMPSEAARKESAAEKAFLLYRRSRRSEFPLTFKSRQLWAKFSVERINEPDGDEDDGADIEGVENGDPDAGDTSV